MNNWQTLKARQEMKKSLRSAKQQARMQANLEQAKQLMILQMRIRLEV